MRSIEARSGIRWLPALSWLVLSAYSAPIRKIETEPIAPFSASRWLTARKLVPGSTCRQIAVSSGPSPEYSLTPQAITPAAPARPTIRKVIVFEAR